MEEQNELYITGAVQTYKEGKLVEEDLTVIDECHLRLFMNDAQMLNSKSVSAFTRSMQGRFLIGTDILPDNIEEFALGYCAAKTTVKPEKIKEIRVIPSGEDRFTACVFVEGLERRPSMFDPEEDQTFGYPNYSTNWGSHFTMNVKQLMDGMKSFTSKSELFANTRAVHGAEIYDGYAAIKFMEDINKANAIYKVLGHALSLGIDLSGSAILSTGRVFKETLEACNILGCKFFVSKAAATKQAIEYAMNNDMTLVGFARDDTFKVYCGEERIIFNNIE